MPAQDHPKLSIRLGPEDRSRLDVLARRRNMNLSRCVRTLIREASPDEAPARERLSEEKLLDLLRERALDGNVSAITRLLEIERQRDPKAATLATLQRMAEARRQ